MPLTPEQRALRAKLASYESWANTPDPAGRTAAARANSPVSLGYWQRQVDPDGTLHPAERDRRARARHKAHMTRMSLKASQARARRKATSGGEVA